MSYPKATAFTVCIPMYLSSDHVTPATGKTCAVVISKAGGAFGNPSAGASNATEIANGWYFYALSTTDTGTIGDLIVRFTEASSDPGQRILPVVNANTGGLASLPDAAFNTVGGLGALVSAAGTATAGGTNTLTLQTTTTANLFQRNAVSIVGGTGVGQTMNITSNTTTILTIDQNWITQPDNTSQYVIWATDNAANDANGRVPVQYGTSTGQINLSAGNLAGAVPSVTGAVGSVTGAVGSISGITFPTNFNALLITSDGYQALDWGHIKAPTTSQNLSGTTISTSQVAASVTGAVGSVTGAVGSVTSGVTVTTNNDKTGYSLTTTPLSAASLVSTSGTASAGASATLTLTGASSTDSTYNGQTILLTGGTGAGQARVVSGYVGATKVATVSPAWSTTPDNTSTFVVLAMGRATLDQWLGVTPLALSSQQVQAIVPSSTVVASVTGAVGSVIGAVGSVTGNIGGISGVTIPSTIASPTNITAGTITNVTNLTNAPTAGDFTATMKTSLNAATPASVTGAVGSVTGAVGSVTGNLGGNVNGNVVGSVASVSGSVGSVAGNIAGDVQGKVIGGGSNTITGSGVQASSVVGAVGSVTGAVGSVTGAVGSVTGNVGGNVTGNVSGNVSGDVAGKVLGGGVSIIGGAGVRADSVTGAVGSVTGAVGSVTGAVGSVTSGVTVATNNDKTGYALTSGERISIGTVVAADILVTPANKLVTNSDGSVDAAVTISPSDITAIADAVAAQIPDAAEIAAALGSSEVQYVGPVSPGGDRVILIHGNDYFTVDSLGLAWTINGAFTDWTGGSIAIVLTIGSVSQTVTGVIDTPTGSARAFHFDVIRTIVNSFAAGSGRFQVLLTLPSTHVTSPVRVGDLVVSAGA